MNYLKAKKVNHNLIELLDVNNGNKYYIQNENNDVDTQLEEELRKVTKEFKIIGKYSSIDL